jgi:prepilin-type N-terminal cleavage/methylation domain-containing protein
MRPGRLHPKFGYTLAELLIVVAIMGIVTAISVPRLGKIRDQAQLQGATTRFTRAVFAARQAAIQRGKHAFFKHESNAIMVYVDTVGDGSQSIIITPSLDLTTQYGVTVESPSGTTLIEYDPRGIAAQAAKKVFKFKHTASARQDSLCISKLGNTIREKCP